MAMQVNGIYGNSGTDYSERVKEKQAAEREEVAKKAAHADGKGPKTARADRQRYVSAIQIRWIGKSKS